MSLKIRDTVKKTGLSFSEHFVVLSVNVLDGCTCESIMFLVEGLRWDLRMVNHANFQSCMWGVGCRGAMHARYW